MSTCLDRARAGARRAIAGAAAIALCCSCGGEDPPDSSTRPECFPAARDADPDPPRHTPRWAFEPWLSKDYSSADDTRAFVGKSLELGIPVGVAVIDSPWETDYNTFTPDPTPGRYPDFAGMVADLETRGVRTVVWVTQLLNSASWDLEAGAMTHYESPAEGHDLAQSCGFFVDGGTEYAWWKGKGGAIDFFNPSAVAWWHTRQDIALALGIAGWKLDFGDSYVRSDPVATAAGPVAHQVYSEAYYRDYLAHGVAKRSSDFLTMVRGWDASYDFAPRFYARPEDAPVVWAGDNRRDWLGLADALETTFRSAVAGYVVVGSDVGGYLDHDDKDLLGPEIPFDTLNFARWTAVGALSPLMQLHGRADLMPWTVPDHVDETIALYRYWATLHHELAPFFYSLAEASYAGSAQGIVRPIGDPASWAGDYRYTLGDAFLVAPILDGSGTRDVPLPAGARWYDWWAPAADALPGGTTLAAYDATDRARLPLFVREGAIVPANVDSDVVPIGAAGSTGKLTVLIWPSAAASKLDLVDDDESPTRIDQVGTATGVTIHIARALRATLLRVHVDAPPAGVTSNEGPLAAAPDWASLVAAGTGSFYEAATRSVWVALAAGGARAVTIAF